MGNVLSFCSNFNDARQEELDSLLIKAAKESSWVVINKNQETKNVAELLLEGAGVDAKDSNGRTALIIASKGGNKEIVKALLDERANVNAVDKYGKSALMLASEEGHTEIVEALLDNRANVNAVDKYGKSALMLAYEKSNRNVFSTLLSLYNPDANRQGGNNQNDRPELKNLPKEVAFLLAVVTSDENLRNSIITEFNRNNHLDAIQQQNNDILGAGIDAYDKLKKLQHNYYRTL